MLAGNPLKWTDPTTWPWFIYLWIALLFFGWLRSVWPWFQRRRAVHWPTAEGHIVSVEVSGSKPTFFSGRSRSSPWIAELQYPYSIAGGLDGGHYRRDFPTEEEAREFVRDLEGKSLPIHYNPDKPSISWLSEPALEVLLRNRAPMLATELYTTGGSVSEWSRPFLWAFIWISAAGLVVSLWVHLGAVMGRRVVPEAFFWILHIGTFVVWFPAVLTARSIFGTVNRKDFWKVVLRGSPEWMRYVVYGFFGYAVVNFLLFMMTASNGSSGANPPPAVWRGFSGHWMAFYSAALAILYAAVHARQNSWRCPNGHSIPMGAHYCERCGQPVMRGQQG